MITILRTDWFTRLAQSAMALVFEQRVTTPSSNPNFTKLPTIGLAGHLGTAMTSCLQQAISMELVALDSVLSKFFSIIILYTIMSFTIFFTIFFVLFTFTLFSKILSLFYSWSCPYQSRKAAERLSSHQLPPKVISIPRRTRSLPPMITSPLLPITISLPSTAGSPLPTTSSLSPAATFPSGSQRIINHAQFSPPASPDADSQSGEPLFELNSTDSTAPEPTPLPSHGRPIVVTKTLAGGVTMDMERRCGSDSTNCIYFRVRLPFENSIKAHHDLIIPGESSSYTILSRVPGSANPNDYSLLLRHPTVNGTFQLEFDFGTRYRVGDLFPETEDFRGQFRIRMPNFFQTVVDVIDSFEGRFEQPVYDDDTVTTLSKDMLDRDTSDDGWWFESAPVPASEILSRAISKTTKVPVINEWHWSDEEIRVPTLRRFTFKGIPLRAEDCHTLLSLQVNHLPFAELEHVRLENVPISFDDCLILISQCPRLESLYLKGTMIGESATPMGLFPDESVDLPVMTSMRNLEVHDCNANVWPLLQGLSFQGGKRWCWCSILPHKG
ncbi:hypothetical protein Moror_17046 [Moniliophthora roreri MCA 2997]|uniref:Uncharacterized protein n=2 Tax=Moniliophthora roreri TaxID=221103 RepID=V2YAZ4_MONRO|nr:hypothetical protein Moror_17046 [Moniliophthora roreri MCA 2997]